MFSAGKVIQHTSQLVPAWHEARVWALFTPDLHLCVLYVQHDIPLLSAQYSVQLSKQFAQSVPLYFLHFSLHKETNGSSLSLSCNIAQRHPKIHLVYKVSFHCSRLSQGIKKTQHLLLCLHGAFTHAHSVLDSLVLECSPSCCSFTKYWLWTHDFFSFFTLSSFFALWTTLLFTPLLLSAVCSSSRLFLPLLFSISSYWYHSFLSSHHSSSLFPSFTSPLPVFSCGRFPVSSSLQKGKAASPSRLQWPIESCWAPISLLIGWAGLSRYWEEELALLASCLSPCLPVCLPAWPSLSLQQGWLQVSSHPQNPPLHGDIINTFQH